MRIETAIATATEDRPRRLRDNAISTPTPVPAIRLVLGPRRSHPCMMAAICAAVIAHGSAFAMDSVKLDGFWIEGVTIESIANGKIIYMTSTGLERRAPLAKLRGIRLTLYPELSVALDAIEAGNDERAVRLLDSIQTKAREDWLKQYLAWLRTRALTRLGRPLEAVDAYLELVRMKADDFFLSDPLVEAVLNASGSEKRRIQTALTQAIKRSNGTTRATLEKFLAAILVTAPDATAPRIDQASSGTVQSDREQVGTIGNTSLLLPKGTAQTPVAQLLAAGRFDEALTRANEQLRRGGQRAQKLYLKGMAQLALAERSGRASQYKNAGLSFMRVVIYFPYPKSPYAGPAILEAGYVHQKIDRPDLARKLYDRAAKVLTEETYPDYHQRMLALLRPAG